MLSHILPEQWIGSVTEKGAYDTLDWHDAIADRGAHTIITPQKCQTLEPDHAGEVSHIEALRASTYLAGDLAKLEWVPPPKPCPDNDKLYEAAGAAPHGARL